MTIHSTPIVPSSDNGPMVDARILLEGHTTGRIALDGQIYTLRITKAGKLILTK